MLFEGEGVRRKPLPQPDGNAPPGGPGLFAGGASLLATWAVGCKPLTTGEKRKRQNAVF